MNVPFPKSPKHRWLLPLLTAAGLWMLSFGVPPTTADDGGQSSSQDFQGIIEDSIPNGITPLDFEGLNGNWSQWAEETGNLVLDFYSKDDQGINGRRETLDQIKRRVATMKRALDDPKYAAIHEKLADFYYRLAARVAILEALRDTIELDLTSVGQTNIHSAIEQVAQRGVALRDHLMSIPEGDAWLPYLDLPDLIAATQSDADVGHTLSLIEEVRVKLAERVTFGEELREFLSTEPFLSFEDALTQTTSFVALQNPDGYRDQMRQLASDLMSAIEEYEKQPLTEHTRAIRTYYDDIRKLAPDGGARLTEAMTRYYLNYNARIIVDESLAQSLFNESRFESGFINEMVKHARVTGCQWTNTDAWIDFKPSNNGLRFDLGLKGYIRAKTQGETHLATVYISGRHGFNGQREIFFDGDHFLCKPSRVSVYAANHPNGADTVLSGVPLLGRLTENIAVKEARKQLPEANALTRQKIYQEAKPRFDREVSQNFMKAEYELETRINGPLRRQGLFPDVRQFTSTEHDAMIRARVMEGGELGGSATFPIPVHPTHGILIQMHESLLNNAAQRFGLEGKTFTPDELQAYVQEQITALTGRKTDLSGFLPDQSHATGSEDSQDIETITFYGEDAVRFELGSGAITMHLRIGLNLEGREPIEPQSIRIDLYPTLKDGKLHIEPGETVGVDAIEDVAPGDRGEQITRAKIMGSKMQDIFEPTDVDTIYTFDVSDKKLTLELTDLKVRGGWISAVLTDGVVEGGGPMATAPMAEPISPAPQVAPESVPVPAQDSSPVLQLDEINGASQKARSIATEETLPAPVRR